PCSPRRSRRLHAPSPERRPGDGRDQLEQRAWRRATFSCRRGTGFGPLPLSSCATRSELLPPSRACFASSLVVSKANLLHRAGPCAPTVVAPTTLNTTAQTSAAANRRKVLISPWMLSRRAVVRTRRRHSYPGGTS